MAELLYQMLPRLRKEAGVTVPELARMTIRMGIHEVPQKSIEALESPKRAGQMTSALTLIAIAAALDVEPSVFYEWPIAEAKAKRTSPSRATLAEVAERAAQRRADKLRTPPEDQPHTPPTAQES